MHVIGADVLSGSQGALSSANYGNELVSGPLSHARIPNHPKL